MPWSTGYIPLNEFLFTLKQESDINANWIEDPLTINYTKQAQLCRRLMT
jgi:beta-lactamase class D